MEQHRNMKSLRLQTSLHDSVTYRRLRVKTSYLFCSGETKNEYLFK